jgi:poly(3-hydroxybutyrate) depolymerase
MASRVGVEQSDLIAAIASYEYPLVLQQGTGGTSIPNAKSPVAALYIDGDHPSSPDICGFQSGSVFQSSVDQDMSYWTSSANNNCSALDTSSNFCTGQYDAQGLGIQTSLTEKRASNCSNGTDVQVYKLIGGAHTYYCSNNSGCSPVVNFNNSVCNSVTPCNSNLNSTTGTTLNDVIWKFLDSHPKP